MQVFIDPDKLIQYQITLAEVIIVRTSSSMMSVGMVTEGKRSTVRAEALNYTPETAGNIVVRTDVSPSGTIMQSCWLILPRWKSKCKSEPVSDA